MTTKAAVIGVNTDHHVLRLELPTLPPADYGANRSRGAAWQRQYRVGHGKRGILEVISALVLEQGWKWLPMEKAKVTVTFYLPDRRRRDADGLISRAKPVLDGLVAAGVLAGDSLDVIGWPVYSHEYRKGRPGTIIEVTSNG